MLRSCSRAAGRCVSVVLRTPSLSSRPTAAAAAAAAAGARAGRTALPASCELRLVARRALSTSLSDEQLRRKMDEFNDLFVTAREEMEYAEESKETTYFDEEAAAAKEAVEEAVALFEEVLRSVDEKKRTDIMRSSGLRVEQLKAELDQLLISDDH
ncbi:unnamed protein product [Ectocarpus fasciculatus]